jgi:DNA transformation protein
MKSLAVSASFRTFVLDQFEELGDVVPRSMFGGVGLYRDGLFFGIIAGDVVYLKTDRETIAMFEAAGARPFTPYADRRGSTRYYSVPVGVLESASELTKWGRKAVAVAARAATAKPPSKARRTK